MMGQVYLILSVTLIAVFSSAHAAPTRTYKYFNILNSNPAYDLWWNINATHIEIAVEAASTGWVAIGFSPATSSSNAMLGSDIALGWVSSSVGYLYDYMANANTPKGISLDTSAGGTNDVELLHAEESGSKTLIEFVRRLSTGDTRDRIVNPIVSTRVVWAIYTTADPISAANAPSLKHTHRGSIALTLNPDATVPTAPTSFISTNQDHESIELQWGPPDSDGDLSIYYILQRDSGIEVDSSQTSNGIFTVIYNGTATSFLDTNLDSSTTYYYMLYAVNDRGAGPSNNNTFSTLSDDAPNQIPGVPNPPTLKSSTTVSIEVEWQKPFGTVLQYHLERGAGNGPFVEVYSGSDTYYESTSLVPGEYRFRVAASNEEGKSNFSDPSSFTTAGYFAPRILPGEFTNTLSLLSGRYVLHWKIEFTEDPANPMLVVGVETQGTGWVGFGFGGGMAGADMIIGKVSEGEPDVNEYRGTGQVTPSLKGTQNIETFNGMEDNGKTTIKWKRPFNTGVSTDHSIGFNSVPIIFAYHRSSDALVEHQSSDRGTATEIFYTNTGCPENCNAPNGFCTSNGCNCTKGWGGSDCSEERICESNEDCNGRGTCTNFICICEPGWQGSPTCDSPSITLTNFIGSDEYEFSTSALNGRLNIYWKLIESEKIIEIAILRDGTGWIGFGFGTRMANSDIIVARVVDSNIIVEDTWSSGHSAPTNDASIGGTYDILAVNGKVENGKTTIKFARKWDTGDSRDIKIIEGETSDIIVAFGSSNNLNYHGANREVLKIDFWSGDVSKVDDNLRTAHGIMMLIAWAGFTLSSIFFSKFYRHWDYWFYVHVFFNVISILLTIIAFIIAIIMVEDDFVQTRNVAISHAWIGLFVIIFAVIQVLLGWWSDKVYDPDRKSTPFWPDKLHWYLGRSTVLLAIVNIILGIAVLNLGTGYFVGFIVYLVIVGFLYGYCYISSSRKNNVI